MEVEEAASKIDWQDFEKLVSEILRENGFVTTKNFRFKTGRKYEVDVVATRGGVVLCIDCKQWRGGRYKRSALVKAVMEQEERVKELEKYLEDNIETKTEMRIGDLSKFYPLIVTLMQEDVTREGDTFVVPMWKLNSFILEMEKYL